MALVDHLSEPAKHAGDLMSFGALVAAFFKWLPEIAALLTVIWTLLRIYEAILTVRLKREEARQQLKR